MKKQIKKLEAFRFRKEISDLLNKLSARTGKTKVRIVEDAILLHGGKGLA